MSSRQPCYTTEPFADLPHYSKSLLPPAVVHYAELTSLTNPLNLGLILVVLYLIYGLVPKEPSLPATSLPTSPTSYNWRPEKHSEAMVWRSWTPEELRGYDGTREGNEGGRILFAIRRKVYDVTTGRGFYGPGE